VQQFNKEGHLRWDSLGEFLALAVSIEDLADKSGNEKAHALANALNQANGRYLESNKSPSRKVNELDNRGSHYFLARYWARALAETPSQADLAARFKPIAKALAENEAQILAELIDAQGEAVDIGGYFKPDVSLASAAMRPSATLNEIIDSI
jgi:isocitrate dehydrogenase